MRGNELLDKLELVDPAYIEAAETAGGRKKKRWIGWAAAAAACLCIAAFAVFALPSLTKGRSVSTRLKPLEFSEESTARFVKYGLIEEPPSENSLIYLTEREMFSQENMLIFRGRVFGLANIIVDFNGVEECWCIADVTLDKIYKTVYNGGFKEGESVRMLIPCGIEMAGWVEDTDVIAHIGSATEGIFMARIYGDSSVFEENGAVLKLTDVAQCGLMDGMRWVFLAEGNRLIFFREAYPGAANSKNLDDVEKYVLDMLK